MSMVENYSGIVIKSKTGKTTKFIFLLDNEESLRVEKSKNIFEGVETGAELIERINEGFSDPWDEGRTFNGFVDSFDYDNEYPKFVKKVKRVNISEIDYVGLFSDDAFDTHSRMYNWAKYSFLPRKGIISGTEVDESSSYYGSSDSMEYMEKLFETK